MTINTQGIQEWTVPASGNYRIEAAGAKGGTGAGGVGGNGAFISINVSLAAGTRYSLVIGQLGSNKTSGASYSSGSGGGGTFMYSSTDLVYVLAVAGGGGGAANSTNLNSALSDAHGKADTTTGTSISISGGFISAGGIGGSGGSASSRGALYGGPGIAGDVLRRLRAIS